MRLSRTFTFATASLSVALAAPAALLAQQTGTSSPSLAVAAPAMTARATASTTVATRSFDAMADTAIMQLETFLDRYPASPLRANALFQLGELLVRRADERFNEQQRAAGGDSTSAAASDAPTRPAYGPAIARYEELVRRFPQFDKLDAAAYTLGTLYTREQRYAEAARMFEIVSSSDSSRYEGEALFRLGDAYFEIAAKQTGDTRRATFARAATAYESATQNTPVGGDIYLLSLYKLGWSYYNQATRTNEEAYTKAVAVFGQLVDAYDKLTPEQQARLGLRGEAIEYMAVAFTQVGGAEAANAYFAQRGGAQYKLPILRRVAQSLRDQGDFTRAVDAYQALIIEAPTDSSALAAQREIVDIYQNRTIEPEKAQAARLVLVENFGPQSAWSQANPGLAAQATEARENALRQGGQYLLASAQGGNRARYAEAATLYQRYLTEFSTSDSAQRVNSYYAEALFGQGNYAQAGVQYSRAAYGFTAGTDSASMRSMQGAGQNAIVAFDSALVRNKTDRAAQDSLFAAVDKFAATFPQTDVAKKALIQKGRRASESERWDVLASTFRTYAASYPNDAYTPTAQKLVGDALYKQGQYAEAQVQWELAQGVARSAGRTALADSISRLRTGAAVAFADTLVKQGDFRRAAEEVYVALADKAPESANAPGALRDAIETYMIVVDSGRAKGRSEDDIRAARERAIELSNRLVTQYPTYRYRLQYQSLNARLLTDAGRREEGVQALRKLVADNPTWSGRPDAQIRIAVQLDSLGQKREAAAAYAEFANANRTDKRAADALFNAAVTYQEAGDNENAAGTYATFAARYPRDERAGNARERRIIALRASGDSTAATAELGRLCQNPTSDAARSECARVASERAAGAARTQFERAAALFPAYRDERLVIATKAQLTAAGVTRASATKQRLLRALNAQFAAVIKSGNAEYLAASTYYLGLAQYEYGNFLKNVVLPETLTDAEREAATAGSARQAQAYYDNATKTWQALIDKAAAEEDLRSNAGAARWIERARNAVQGNVDANPSARADQRAPAVGEED